MRRVIIFLFCIALSSCATFSESREYYREAVHLAKIRNDDAAFSKFKQLLHDDSRSRYAPKAAFAIAEYYFDSGDYFDATVAFREYINAYPEDEGVIFAELMIFKMVTQINPNKNIPYSERYFLENIRKKMFNKPIFFIFAKNRENFTYRSAFGNIYSAFDYIDKVTIRRNDKIFFELSP